MRRAVASAIRTRGLKPIFRFGLTAIRPSAPDVSSLSLRAALDQRFGNVNEFRTAPSSNYNGLQTSLTEQFHALTSMKLHIIMSR